MSELSERVAVQHKRVWNRLNITCLCGWDTTAPPIGDSRPFIAHVADVTEAAVRETIAADIEARQITCPLHHMTDCSPLLNGCGLIRHLHEQRTIDARIARGET